VYGNTNNTRQSVRHSKMHFSEVNESNNATVGLEELELGSKSVLISCRLTHEQLSTLSAPSGVSVF